MTVEQPERRSWGSAVGSLATVVVVVLLALVTIALFSGDRAAISLDPGECLRAPETEQVVDVETVPCSEPHELEVIGTVTMTGDEYPGDERSFRSALDLCQPTFEDYIGVDYDTSAWVLNVFTPSEEGWDSGDRTATCLVFQFDEGLDYLPVTGTARDSGT